MQRIQWPVFIPVNGYRLWRHGGRIIVEIEIGVSPIFLHMMLAEQISANGQR
jgi:hypothetical protein